MSLTAFSWVSSLSRLFSRYSFACSVVKPEIRLQHVELALFQCFRFREAVIRLFVLVAQDFFFGLKAFHLFVESFFFLLDAPFLALNFFPAIVDFTLRLGTLTVNFVFAFENGFFFLCFRRFDGVAYNSFCFLFCRAYGIFSGLFAVF